MVSPLCAACTAAWSFSVVDTGIVAVPPGRAKRRSATPATARAARDRRLPAPPPLAAARALLLMPSMASSFLEVVLEALADLVELRLTDRGVARRTELALAGRGQDVVEVRVQRAALVVGQP